MDKGDHKSAPSTHRELDETELDLIVGGVAKAAAARTEIDHLIQQDLAGHDTGQDHTHEIAAMIASGAVSASVAIHDMEANAAKDGNHSVDQQLAQVNAALKQAHATGAASIFAQEENNRLGSGAAAADLAHLIAKGASPGAAVAVLQQEAQVSGSHKLGAALGALESRTGGSAEIEQALGGLVKSGEVSAADAISRVEHAASASHRSVDEALSHLDDGAGGNKAIHAEELHRVQTHQIETDLAHALKAGTITGTAAVSLLASEVSHGAIKESNAINVLLATEKAGGDSAIEAELGHRIATGEANAAAVVAAVVAGTAKVHGSVAHALEQLELAAGGNAAIEIALGKLIKSGGVSAAEVIRTVEAAATTSQRSVDAALSHVGEGAGRNAAVEAEERRRVTTHATEHDLAAAMKAGLMSGAAAAGVLASEVSHGAIKEADALKVLLALERNGSNAGIEAELAHRVRTGDISAKAVISAIEAGAEQRHVSADQLLMRLDTALGHNAVVKAEMASRLVDGSAARDLAELVGRGMNPTSAANILLGEHKLVSPGLTATAHSLANLMEQMWLHGVSAKDVAAVAKANSATLVSGFLAEVKAGTATQIDIKAAAEVFELGLGKFSAAAEAKAEAPFQTLERSAAGKAVLAQIHHLALQGAVDQGVLSAADAQKWTTAFQQIDSAATPIKADAATKAAFTALDDLLQGKVNGYAAMAELAQIASKLHMSSGDLIKHAASQLTDDRHALALMEVAKSAYAASALSNDEQLGVNNLALQELARPGHALSNAVFALADSVASGKMPVSGVASAMDSIGWSLPYYTSATQLLQVAATQITDVAHASAFISMIEGMRNGADIGPYTCAQMERGILEQVVDANRGLVDPGLVGHVLANTVLSGSYGSMGDAEARSIIGRCVTAAGDGAADRWLSTAHDAVTGNSTVLKEVVDAMARRVDSGALVAQTARQIQEGHLTPAQGVDFAAHFAGQVDSNHVATAMAQLIAATHGNAAVEQAVVKQAVQVGMDRHQLMSAVVDAVDPPDNISVLNALVRVDGYLGGREPVFAAGIGQRLVAGVSTDIVHAVQTGHMGVAAGEKLIAAAIELASGNQRSGSFESHLPEKLLGGAVVQDLVHAAATHRITGSAAISVASDVVKLVEAQSGAARLPGPAEAQYVLAKLDAAAQDAQLTDLHKELQSNYGLALNIGNTIAPLVDELGWKVGALALNIGTQLASMTDPTTGGEAASIVKLETAARSAGVSVDAALALAGMNAIGHSQVLNLEITDRLLSGTAEKELAGLVAHHKISPADAVRIVETEVRVLASSNRSNVALGFDSDTAQALALAKLNLAAAVPGGFPAGSKPVNLDHAPNNSLQTYLETNYAKELLSGLGVVAGLLAADSTAAGNAPLKHIGDGGAAGANQDQLPLTYAGRHGAELATAQMMAQRLMPDIVSHGIADGPDMTGMNSDEVKQEIGDIVKADAKLFTDSYGKGFNFREFQKEYVYGKKDASESSIDRQVALHTYTFEEVGVSIGTSAGLTTDIGAGFSVSLDAHAGAAAGVTVTANRITVEAAATAAASAELDLGSHAKLMALAQAIAAGSVEVGVDGVKLTANAGVAAKAELSQTEQGSLGAGFDGMQTTALTAGAYAGVDGAATVKLTQVQCSYGAKVGAYASASEQGNISYEGFTIGAGATIASPGVLGLKPEIGVDISSGDIAVHFGGFIGAALFGVGFNVDFTLPTSKVVDALKAIGADLGNAVLDGFGEAIDFLTSPITLDIRVSF